MCDINFKIKAKRKSGYKVVAVDKDNNVYSIFTGQKYQLGKVELPPVKAKPITNWNIQLSFKKLIECTFYKIQYLGFTSVFVNKKIAIKYLNDSCVINNPADMNYKLKLAKFTFAGDTFKGKYEYNLRAIESANVIAGNYIQSIEILN